MSGHPVHVLLVEDNEIDVELTRRAFKKRRIQNSLTVVSNGLEALQMLRGSNGYPQFPRPYLILLDVHLPGMNGTEFLHHLRQDPELQHSVVFVLTSSHDDQDRFAAYQLPVAGYMLKQRIGEEFFALPELLANYWRLVELPARA
jgi:CheY-like chemotaxis protein